MKCCAKARRRRGISIKSENFGCRNSSFPLGLFLFDTWFTQSYQLYVKKRRRLNFELQIILFDIWYLNV